MTGSSTTCVWSVVCLRRSQVPGTADASHLAFAEHHVNQGDTAARLRFQVVAAVSSHNPSSAVPISWSAMSARTRLAASTVAGSPDQPRCAAAARTVRCPTEDEERTSR